MTPFFHHARPRAVALALSLLASASHAASPAASACADYFGVGPDIADNSSFETLDPSYDVAAPCGSGGAPSAADGWDIRTDKPTKVCTWRIPTQVHERYMLLVETTGQLGGIWQRSRAEPGKAYMFSVWIKALSGQVSIQSRGMSGGPVASTTKGLDGRKPEWEQLRVCTNSLAETDYLFIISQTPTARFLVDRAELREIPIRE